MSNVSGIIKSIQALMRKDVGVDGDAQRISQLVWMFFLKIFDDREAELELIEDDYKSLLLEHLRWRNWARNPEGMTGEPLAAFVNELLFPTLKEKLVTHGPAGERARVIRSVFEDAYNYMSGYEKKALPHMLAVTNMILHGIDSPTSIKHDNTLSRPYKDYGNADRVHVIVTNPPFGGMEEDGIENNFPAHLRTRETADLFMAVVIKLLKDQGRAAVVLPDGFLFGEGMKTRLKQTLLEECNLHTIVRLPNGVFNPYTGIKTNLLFFTKGKPTEHVWYYEHPYQEGAKSYNKTKPMRFEEFETEIAWWGTEADGFKARVQTAQAWKVPVADIVARNYNLDIKNPHIGEQVSHDPDKLLRQYRQQQDAIADLRNQRKDILQQALHRGEAKTRQKKKPTTTTCGP